MKMMKWITWHRIRTVLLVVGIIIAVAILLFAFSGQEPVSGPPVTVTKIDRSTKANENILVDNGHQQPDLPKSLPRPLPQANGDQPLMVFPPAGNGQILSVGSGRFPASLPDVPADSFEFYTVKLDATENLFKPGSAGVLIVWIGESKYTPKSPGGTVSESAEIAAVGKSAKVTPHAPDFEVTPNESRCIEIHPTGSEVVFTLVPVKSGSFNVSASVNLFSSDDCSGAPVPKSAATLSVKVTVDWWGTVKSYLLQLWEVFWEGFLKFWGWLVGAVLGVMAFLIRDRIKRIFGFDVPGPGGGAGDN